MSTESLTAREECCAKLLRACFGVDLKTSPQSAAEIYQILDMYFPSPSDQEKERDLHLKVVLCIAHWDLHYHGLLSEVRALLVTRRKLSDAQSAVLTTNLDRLAERAESPPPAWPTAAQSPSRGQGVG